MSTTFRRAHSGLYIPRLPPGYAGQQLARGTLMGYWRQTETSGTTMGDAGPGGHNGTYRTTKTAVTSLLTGDSDSATTTAGDVGVGSWLNVSDITIECIIKTPASIAGNQGVFTRFGSFGHCWLLWINVSGQIAARFYNTSGASVDINWATTPSVNTKYHLAAKYTSGLAELVIDGTVKDASSTSTALTGALQTSASQDFETMAYNSGSFGFTGVGDEFSLNSVALSTADLASDAALV